MMSVTKSLDASLSACGLVLHASLIEHASRILFNLTMLNTQVIGWPLVSWTAKCFFTIVFGLVGFTLECFWVWSLLDGLSNGCLIVSFIFFNLKRNHFSFEKLRSIFRVLWNFWAKCDFKSHFSTLQPSPDTLLQMWWNIIFCKCVYCFGNAFYNSCI